MYSFVCVVNVLYIGTLWPMHSFVCVVNVLYIGTLWPMYSFVCVVNVLYFARFDDCRFVYYCTAQKCRNCFHLHNLCGQALRLIPISLPMLPQKSNNKNAFV